MTTSANLNLNTSGQSPAGRSSTVSNRNQKYELLTDSSSASDINDLFTRTIPMEDPWAGKPEDSPLFGNWRSEQPENLGDEDDIEGLLAERGPDLSPYERNRIRTEARIDSITENFREAIEVRKIGLSDIVSNYHDKLTLNHVGEFLSARDIEDPTLLAIGNKVDVVATALTAIIHSPLLLLDLLAGVISPDAGPDDARTENNVLGPIVSLISDTVFTVVKVSLVALLALGVVAPVTLTILVCLVLLFLLNALAIEIKDGIVRLHEFCKDSRLQKEIDKWDTLLNDPKSLFQWMASHPTDFETALEEARQKLNTKIAESITAMKVRIMQVPGDEELKLLSRVSELEDLRIVVNQRFDDVLKHYETCKNLLFPDLLEDEISDAVPSAFRDWGVDLDAPVLSFDEENVREDDRMGGLDRRLLDNEIYQRQVLDPINDLKDQIDAFPNNNAEADAKNLWNAALKNVADVRANRAQTGNAQMNGNRSLFPTDPYAQLADDPSFRPLDDDLPAPTPLTDDEELKRQFNALRNS